MLAGGTLTDTDATNGIEVGVGSAGGGADGTLPVNGTVKSVTVSSTMGPGVPVDPNRTRSIASDDEA